MLYSVQFLRGVAALIVVLAHIAFKGEQYSVDILSWFHVGSVGVDLFFIISGFIMCYTTDNKEIYFHKFIRNRLERIVPLYWVLTFVALIIFIVKPSLINSSGGTTSIIDSFLLLPNGNKFLIQNGWTLSYEFYFYFIFATALLFFRNRIKRYSAVVTSLIFLSIIGLLINTEIAYLDFLTSNYLLEFALGIVAFLVFKKSEFKISMSVVFLLLGLILMGYQNFNGIFKLPFDRSISYGMPMFLIFIGMLSLEGVFRNTKNIISNFFEKLGDSSYSLYLAHPFAISPVAMACKYLGINNPYLFLFLLTFSAIFTGFFVFYFIEKPLIKFIKKLSGSNKTTHSHV